MPGKKDFVFVRLEDKRVHVQIGLVLCNLKKVYSSFKDARFLEICRARIST